MKKFSLVGLGTFIIIFLFAVTACKKKDDEEAKADFDRKSMLENIGTNIIIPNYLTLNTAVNKLDSAVADFNLSPDLTKLGNIQSLFIDAYKAWQSCSMFEFGPAEQELLRINLNTFPATTSQIESNIASGSYDLGAASNFSAKGFPAIDYLLFGIGADNNSILLKYTTDPDAANRKQYLEDIVIEIKSKVNTVYNQWIPSGGNYLQTFKNAEGTDVGSSTGALVNQLNKDLEITKNYRFGVPLGKQSGGVTYPEKVEGYYSGISVELATLHIQALENLYLGRSSSGNGVGFDDYLDHLDAGYNGGSLNAVIQNQLATTLSKLALLSDPLSDAIQNNQSAVDAAYVELQKMVVLTKTDMASALSILITYVDNDGD